VKFVKDYAAAGLKENVPLLASGFLTDGLLDAEGEAAEGIVTVLHYADDLDNPADRRFRAAYRERYGEEPDLHSVQGYDTGVLLIEALTAVQGNTGDQAGLIAAMENVELDSPRGKVTFSKAHNPIQDIYLREVKDGANRLIKVAAPALDDPATGCEMAAE
jgi:branched-chain amino acid transport system substrate-binding protein